MTIYKKDTKGNIRVLTVTTDGAAVIQTSGLLDGKLTVNSRVAKAKNVGKRNETTPAQQAEIEAEAIIVKKLKEGYFETIEEAQNHVNLMPMLASKVNLEVLTYPVFIQPKLDGVRCVGTNKAKLSRKNREIDTIEHIDLSFFTDDVILDGELYEHGKTFQENISAIKKYKEGITEGIKYHVYDMPSVDGTFSERFEVLARIVDNIPYIELVETVIVNDEEGLISKHKEFLANGFEGSIVRTNDTAYEFNKRSKSLMKLKDFIDAEYEVVDIIPSDKRPTQGVVACRLEDGRIFNATPAATHEKREEMLTNKADYIGKQATIEYFELTDAGIPRFPIYKSLRDYE